MLQTLAGTLANLRGAPMTVLWREDDPAAVPLMADRIKAWRPETDPYNLGGVGHQPSIEAPEVIADAVLHRLSSE